MIKVTRLNGRRFCINPHQIETIEATPDTVITLMSGQRYVVRESVDKVIELIVEYRRRLGMIAQEG
jgi:flagellar protein FlbD